MDHFVMTYGPFPFAGYSLCFVDDVRQDVLHKGSLSICSSRLLYPDDIIDPIDTVTRTLVHALAYQYLGVSIVPRETNDIWIIVGCSYFMTEIFLESLLGKNHYRHQQKLNADKVVALDVRRPSLYDLGPAIALHPSELEFMILKAPLVLFILHRRLSTKAASKLGVNRIIWRLCLNTKTGDLLNGAVSTPYFLRVAEKAAHGKLDVFFSQWIYGAGCPHFVTTQRFNKKKLVVEMLIKQVQADALDDTARPENFLRDVREAHEEVEPGPLQTLFTVRTVH